MTRLHEADEQQVPAGDRVDDAEEVRIQRRLVEHLAPQPVAGRDPPRPLVVAARVAHQHREERRDRICRRARAGRRTRSRRWRARHQHRGRSSDFRRDRPSGVLRGQQRYASPATPSRQSARSASTAESPSHRAILVVETSGIPRRGFTGALAIPRAGLRSRPAGPAGSEQNTSARRSRSVRVSFRVRLAAPQCGAPRNL